MPWTCSFSGLFTEKIRYHCVCPFTCVPVSVPEWAYWFSSLLFFSKQNGERLAISVLQAVFVSGTVHLFVFLCVPCGVHWRVEKKGKAVANSLAKQRVPGLYSQQWTILCSLHTVWVLWLPSSFPLIRGIQMNKWPLLYHTVLEVLC